MNNNTTTSPPLNTYSYVNNQPNSYTNPQLPSSQNTVQAPDPNTAISIAPNISPTSGVQVSPAPTPPKPADFSGQGTQNGQKGSFNSTGQFNANASTITPDNDISERERISKSLYDMGQNVTNTINNITNGSIPLNAGEQAQIDALKSQFNKLIDDQTLQNKNSTGIANIRGYQTGAAEYDPTFQTKTIGTIVTAGLNKVADLNIKMAGAVAQLTQSLKDNDIKNIKDAYDVYKSSSDDRISTLNDTIKEANDAIKQANDDYYNRITKPINDIATEAAKNGANSKVISAISASGSVQDAINAAGGSLQTATGTLGDYLQYKRDSENQGLVPMSYQAYKDKQDAADLQKDIKKIYATASAKAQADAAVTSTDKVQQKLEQQYRQVLAKEFSARTGALGVENAKVNQANHLNSLITQYYDPKTGQYNIPTSQYAELVLGLANLISPGGASSEGDRAEIRAKTAAGDIKGAVQYITGVPQNGNTQAIINNLIDSVDRQAQTAVRNRETALQNMRDQAPTDLEPSRIDALNKSTEMVSYEGQDRLSKKTVDSYIKANPNDAEDIAKMYEVPGATNKDIEDYLRANGKIQ